MAEDNSKPRAVVREIDGQLVLDDPEALEVFKTVAKYNCYKTFMLNADRVAHFKKRVTERGLSVKDVVIVLINVDDPHGGPITDALMPNTDWQAIREHGEVPFARGIAEREGVKKYISIFDKEAGEALEKIADLAVVVIDYGVAVVFPVYYVLPKPK